MYSFAQTFFLDPSIVKGAPVVNLTQVDLFFRLKPKRTGNRSGIEAPGVTLFICRTNTDGTPNFIDLINGASARLEYDEIVTSGDAQSASHFVFAKPCLVETNKQYCILAKFDGFEDFAMWASKEGDFLVGTNVKSPGPSGQYIGNYYDFNNAIALSPDILDPMDLADGYVGPAGGAGSTPVWKPRFDYDLKFTVFVARYRNTTSNTISSNTATPNNEVITLPANRYEFIIYNDYKSEREKSPNKGELFYQNTAFHRTGVLNVSANSLTITGSNGVNFNTLYDQNAINDKYIVIVSENDDAGHPSGNYDKVDVRKISSFVDNTTITIDSLPRIQNSACRFLLPTAVARLDFKDRSKSFGKKRDLMVLEDSNANASVRFVNNTIETVTITVGGTGYSNTDYVVFVPNTAAAPDGVNAVANLVTNSTGGVIEVYVSNGGCGHVETSTFSVKNSIGGSSAGSSLALSWERGPTIRSHRSKFFLKKIEVINYEMHTVKPDIVFSAPAGIKADMKYRHGYYVDSSNTWNVNKYSSNNDRLIKKFKKNDIPTGKKRGVIMSWSNEVLELANTDGGSNGSTVIIDVVSNNDFMCAVVEVPPVYIYRNIINNDYTGENGRYGNAWSKGISTKVNFAQNRLAEDVIVYASAYRPANTDIKVFAKIHNSADTDAFDDKDWTLLDAIDNGNVFSSSTDANDYFEITFGLPGSANVESVANGSISTTLSSAAVVGVGSSLNTMFVAGDLVKVSNPLFPNNYIVDVVNSVTNTTHLTLKNPIANNGVVGAVVLEKLAFKHQAFNNIDNDNVARYYNSGMTPFDRYDTFAIKVVLLADDASITPNLEDIRVIGVSA